MTMPINAVEARILGALIEKELTTPEYYPLTLNSLTNACNQKSNRDPVMQLEEEAVVRGLDKLRMKGFARLSGEGGRVPKYCHSLGEKLAPPELAVLAELLLRGPQTLGELRTRCDRMSAFADTAAVEEVLADLQKYELQLATLLPRQPGQKEQRYAHLLGRRNSAMRICFPASRYSRRLINSCSRKPPESGLWLKMKGSRHSSLTLPN